MPQTSNIEISCTQFFLKKSYSWEIYEKVTCKKVDNPLSFTGNSIPKKLIYVYIPSYTSPSHSAPSITRATKQTQVLWRAWKCGWSEARLCKCTIKSFLSQHEKKQVTTLIIFYSFYMLKYNFSDTLSKIKYIIKLILSFNFFMWLLENLKLPM